jgi:beta-glucanase (GH16 family)
MRRYRLAVAIPFTAVVVFWCLGIPGASAGAGARAPAASTARSGRAASGATSAVPTPKRKPTLDATFTGSHLNKKVWDTCYPTMANFGGGCTNWGNREELEWYLPSQVRVSGGYLHLIAKREKTNGFTANGTPATYGCRSGMVTSYPGFKFKYGFVQVVANIPHRNGLWPALWLAAANGKSLPEMDMVESWGVAIDTGTFFHPVKGRSFRARYSPKLTVGWHTYSMSWTKSKLAFWVDKKLVLRAAREVPRQQMFFLADLADRTPTQRHYCTGQMLIKSVKIWTP